MGGRGISDLRECVVLDKRACNDGIVVYVYSKKPVDVRYWASRIHTLPSQVSRKMIKDACNISLVDYCLLVY